MILKQLVKALLVKTNEMIDSKISQIPSVDTSQFITTQQANSLLNNQIESLRNEFSAIINDLRNQTVQVNPNDGDVDALVSSVLQEIQAEASNGTTI